MLPLSNFLNRLKIGFSKQNSPSQRTSLKNNNITGDVTVNQGQQRPTPDETEQHRRRQLVSALRNQWLLSNDGITPARMAGLEWGNGELGWVNQQLESRGENWQV